MFPPKTSRVAGDVLPALLDHPPVGRSGFRRFRISFTPSQPAAYLHSGVTSTINAAAIAVHKALGPGFLEAIYEEAFCIELDRQHLPYQRQFPVRVYYEHVPVGLYRLDLVVDKKIVVEVKAASGIDAAHVATVLAYLKATCLQVGLIVNFASEVVRIKRVFRDVHGVKEVLNS